MFPAQSGRAHEWQQSWRLLHERAMDRALHVGVEHAASVAASQGFVLTNGQARASGVQSALLRRLIRRGWWRSVCRGVVTVVGDVDVEDLEVDAYEYERITHALRAAAAVLVRPGHLVCGRSAGVLLGLPVMRTPIEPVITARVDRTLGLDSGVLVRRSAVHPSDEQTWFGLPVTSVARTVADLARLDRFDGIMAADAMLREGLAAQGELREVLERCVGWPGVRTARLVESLADARAESPLESVVRLRLHLSDLPRPVLQLHVRGADGRSYRPDFCWPEARLVLEADGRTKYTGDELWAEKERELALVRVGFRVERVVWADVGRRWPVLESRLQSVLRSASPAA